MDRRRFLQAALACGGIAAVNLAGCGAGSGNRYEVQVEAVPKETEKPEAADGLGRRRWRLPSRHLR
jgi:hypothetical protein